MDFTVFPVDFKKQLDEDEKRKIEEEKVKKDARQCSLENSKKKEEEIPGYGFIPIIFGIMGLLYWGIDLEITLGALTKSVMVPMIVGVIIMCIMIDRAEKKYIAFNKNVDVQISQEDKNLTDKINEIKQETQKKELMYKETFEKKCQGMSVTFAESELASEVINWISKGFSKTIMSADRESHIEKIEVPFIFEVYTYEISCNLGVYDFEKKRCEKLKNPFEQTALARAIAAAIQLNITMEFTQDITGTDAIVDIFYDYKSDCARVTMKYTAPNGNYKSIRNW